MNKEILGPIYLSLAAIIWGGMYAVSKYALDIIPPFTLLFLRYIIACVVLGTISWHSIKQIQSRRDWVLLLEVGIIGYFLSISAQFIGTKLSSAHLGALVTTLSPAFLSIFAIFILNEKISRRQIISIVIALLGVLTILGIPEVRDNSNHLLGGVVLLFAAVCWGYYSAIARKLSQVYSPLQITTIGIVIAAILSLPPAFIFERNAWNLSEFNVTMILCVLYLSCLSTALAFLLWNQGLQLTNSHKAGVFFFFQPIVGGVSGWIFLQEKLSISFVLGSLIVLLGVYLNISDSSATFSVTAGNESTDEVVGKKG